jgi:endonuclease/exonuclease/phosphatase family metal-dependent hydrolase
MKKLCFLFVLFLALYACSVSEPATPADEAGVLTLMTWNVQNLFDGMDNGFEYDEFKQSGGWSSEKYMGRVNTISAAIGRLTPTPDIIMLEEIESEVILEDLALSMPKGGYSWCHFANNHGASVGLGILSSLPLTEAKTHSITVDGETTPRPVLEARVQTEEGDIILFVCHWKSKIGDDEVTENIRKSSARVILRRIREISGNEPETGFIIAGDLNENYDEFYRQDASSICALIPDDSYCVKLSNVNTAGQKDFLIISGNKPPEPVHFPQGSITLFSPWMRDLLNGTYFYKYNWETIDHFLISGHFFDSSGWKYEKVIIANFEPFANSSGIPVPYNTKTGLGLSDHLPLLLTIKLTL